MRRQPCFGAQTFRCRMARVTQSGLRGERTVGEVHEGRDLDRGMKWVLVLPIQRSIKLSQKLRIAR